MTKQQCKRKRKYVIHHTLIVSIFKCELRFHFYFNIWRRQTIFDHSISFHHLQSNIQNIPNMENKKHKKTNQNQFYGSKNRRWNSHRMQNVLKFKIPNGIQKHIFMFVSASSFVVFLFFCLSIFFLSFSNSIPFLSLTLWIETACA